MNNRRTSFSSTETRKQADFKVALCSRNGLTACNRKTKHGADWRFRCSRRM